jgi:hypothetical protein
MSCANIKWKQGYDMGNINIGDVEYRLNYFSCGKYFFDGNFNVVEFPEGMSIYHGSKSLPRANVRFPVGVEFYKPHDISAKSNLPYDFTQKVASSDQSIEEVLSNYIPVIETWFANPKTSLIYAKSSDNIFAYKLTKPTKFLILDDNFNLAKLLTSSSVPSRSKYYLRLMFTLPDTVKPELDKKEYGKIQLSDKKIRKSVYSWDREFAKFVCDIFPKDYAGYCANVQVFYGIPIFHLEFMFCNPFNYIERDLNNSIDWQHNPIYNPILQSGDILQQYLTQLSYYKSTNVEFHSGNLIEHSIWCLLFTEDLLTKPIGEKYQIKNQQLAKVITATSFIHDIGKMAPWKCYKREHDLIYFAIKEHPQFGKEFINGTRNLPLLDMDMKEVGIFDVKKLLIRLGIQEIDINHIADLVGHHWDFGAFLIQYSKGNTNAVDAYIDFIGRTRSWEYFYSLIIISMADVMSAQPFIGAGSKNITSKYFPEITNLPKRYQGSNLAVKQAIVREEFATLILDKIHNDKFGFIPRKKKSFNTLKRLGPKFKQYVLGGLEKIEEDMEHDIEMEEDNVLQKQNELFEQRELNRERKEYLTQQLQLIETEEQNIIDQMEEVVNKIGAMEEDVEEEKIKILVEEMDVDIPDTEILMEFQDEDMEEELLL